MSEQQALKYFTFYNLALLAVFTCCSLGNTIECPPKSFPKVIGSNSFGTKLFSIDYHAGKNMLTVSGNTFE